MLFVDRSGYEMKIGDQVFHHPAGDVDIVVLATVEYIDGMAVKIRNHYGWQWTNRSSLEYATPEKLFLYELEN